MADIDRQAHLMRQVAPQHRTATSRVSELIMHTQAKLDALPELAAMHGLTPEATKSLAEFLEAEIQELNNRPPDSILAELLPDYHDSEQRFRETFLANSPLHQNRHGAS